MAVHPSQVRPALAGQGETPWNTTSTAGNTHRKGEIDVDHDGIAWVSGHGGTRGLTDPLRGDTAFLLEVAGVTPGPDVGTPAHADWFLA